MQVRMIFQLLLLITLGLLLGCGEQREAAPVTGKVTIGGAPARDLIVRFQPKGTGDTEKLNAGMGSYGKTDDQGMYTLKFTDNDRTGALVGEHVVVIDELTPPEEENNDAGFSSASTSRIPKKWNSSEHFYTVKSGENEANFELND